MSKTKIIFAVALVNLVIVAGIMSELGNSKDDVNTSTIVTAKLMIKYANAGDNETLIFETVTTSESTVFGLLIAASSDGNYEVEAENSGQGVTVTNIILSDCDDCKQEDGFSWQYTLNGFYNDIPANRNVISNNDVVEWVYTNEI